MKNDEVARVTSVEVLRDYLVRLKFSDGVVRDLDLDPLLRGPVFAPLRDDRDLFLQIRVDDELGTIVWSNGADIDPDVLRGKARPAWATSSDVS